jgi:hypothetical protein
MAPIIAAEGKQPHADAVTLDDQAIAVVLDFVDPVRPSRNFGSARRRDTVRTQFYAWRRERRKCESAPAPPIGACSSAI